MAMLKFQCCGVLEQICGGSEYQVVLPMFPVQVDEALAQLAEAIPAMQEWLPRTACAVGDEIVARNHVLNGDETLVLLPPVSGG